MRYTPQRGKGQVTSKGFRLVLGILLLGAFLVAPEEVALAGEKLVSIWRAGPKFSTLVPTLVDSAGQVIGVIDQSSRLGGNAEVVMRIGGIPTVVSATTSEIRGQKNHVGVYFESSDCTGTALIMASDLAGGPITFDVFGWPAVSHGQFLYVPKTDPSQPRSPNSYFHPDFTDCGPIFSPTDYVEALTFPLSIFNVFVPPFSVTGMRSMP